MASGGKASSIPLMGGDEEPSLFEIARPGRTSATIRATTIKQRSAEDLIPSQFLRDDQLDVGEISERDLTAHMTRLSHRQYAVDLGAYPLGSCTMKYNPKVCDEIAGLAGLTNTHPAAPARFVQGGLELYVSLETALCEVTGMAAATLQPPAGAAGELTGLLLMRAYHESTGRNPTSIVIPDSAHGTNPASVTLGGYNVVTVPTDARGCVDLEALKSVLSDDIAGIMLTNPSTLGLFERDIAEIASLIHGVGGLLYYDGANLNAVLGISRPGDMGFDVVHMNLHKTFAVPHGGGGPGAGPVAVGPQLVDFLPGPRAVKTASGTFDWLTPTHSIGRVHGWHGNALALARAYAYLILNGGDGLKKVSEVAVLNANWLRNRLRDVLPAAFDDVCMHEFVATMADLKASTGLKAFDIAKAIMDEGFHAPTVYFPLIVEEALMLEPTETESLETLEEMAQAFERVVLRTRTPEGIDHTKSAPLRTPVQRVDEARAARTLVSTFDARVQSPHHA